MLIVLSSTCTMCVYALCMYVYSLQASLERIGVDSKGTVYWYDGGKNMFQSPPSNDPAYKPRYNTLYDKQVHSHLYNVHVHGGVRVPKGGRGSVVEHWQLKSVALG